MENDPAKKASVVPGITVMTCLLITVIAIVMGLGAATNEQDFVATGICLIAAALASGLLANAVWRK